MTTSFASLAGLGLCASLASSVFACGSSGASAPGLGGTDAGTSDADAAAPPVTPDPTYPAAHALAPPVDLNGGPVLSAMSLVTVTFDGDPLRDLVEGFDDAVLSSDWWSQVAPEYCAPAGSATCVGAGPTGGHVHLAAPATLTFTDSNTYDAPSTIVDFLRARVSDGSLPLPDGHRVYLLYLPDGASFTLDGRPSCVKGGLGGYHKTTTVTPPGGGAGLDAIYAVIPRCTVAPKTTEETTTFYASHEIIETATDPYTVENRLSFFMDDLAWGLLGGEVADLCEDRAAEGLDLVTQGGFTFARSWSNARARAGGNPCVPVPPGEVYFNLAPDEVAGQSSAYVSLGIGESATFHATAFSTAPSADWQLDAVDYATLTGGSPSLAFAFEPAVVNNGTRVQVTVTLKAAAQQQASGPKGVANVEPFFLESKRVDAAGTRNIRLWPGVVTQK